jgi:serine protease AprX
MDTPPSPEIDTEVDPLVTYSAPPLRIRWGFSAICAAALLTIAVSLSLAFTTAGVPTSPGNGHPAAATLDGGASPALVKLAATKPGKQVEAIVQFKTGVKPADARQLVRTNGGRVTGDLHVINGLATRISAGDANRLASTDGVQAVSLNAATKPQAIDPNMVVTSYNESLASEKVWNRTATGKGVGVAVIDTGIAGNLPDFRVSASNSASRVVATAATNPYAKNDDDEYGHGTHVAGIIAGNSNNRPSSDPLRGKYVGVAPDANLISIKASDDDGGATVLDAIYGLQFAVDNKAAYNIRVVNLSLESTQAQSYKTDPLDAAVEAAWFSGIVVVAAAGNRGGDSDAVSYAPGNDPFVISVGGVDDQGTKNNTDDELASWSSRGRTQDGFAKPEVTAPGAHIVSLLSPDSDFASMCPSCIVSGQYIRAGGTSMAAPMVAGLVALMLEEHPNLTPNQVKGIIMDNARSISGAGEEAYAPRAVASTSGSNPNAGIAPNPLVNPATGAIDYTRSSWSRSSWSRSSWSRSSWSRSSWSCACSKTSSGKIDPTRSSWSRSSWSTSWTK